MSEPLQISERTRNKLYAVAFIAGMLAGNGIALHADHVSTEQAKCDANFGKDYDASLRRCVDKPSKH